MMKRLKYFVLPMVVFISLILPSVYTSTAAISASELVEEALSQKTFYHFNVAYSEVISLKDENEKNILLGKLATIVGIVTGPEIKKINNALEEIVKTASGKLYDQIQVDIQKADIPQVDKEYLMGEVNTWGRQLVWTEDYSTAMNSLLNAWEKKDPDSVGKAERDINLVKNLLSRAYLLDELAKIKSVEQVIAVNNIQELMANIGSNRTLILKAGDYNLLSSGVTSEFISYQKVYDGNELILKNIHNLKIKGEDGAKVQLLVEPRYANVITFNNCKGISVENIIAGHYPDKGFCSGGVFVFKDSKDINIDKTELFGCGTEGLRLINVSNLYFNNSTIKECSNRIMLIRNSNNVKFNNSNFYKCGSNNLIDVADSSEVEFNKSNIYDNAAGYAPNFKYIGFLFSIGSGNVVKLTDCTIKNNTVKAMVNDEKRLILNNVEFVDNVIK